MKFTLEIEMDGRTPMAGHYLGYLLQEAASKLRAVDEGGKPVSEWEAGERNASVFDSLGNRVGEWSIFDDQQQARIDRMAAIQRHHDDKSEDPGHHCEACPHPQDGSTCKACTETVRDILQELERDEEFHCAGCGREESECSRNPCARVIEDRES
jgi:hypothetical protein